MKNVIVFITIIFMVVIATGPVLALKPERRENTEKRFAEVKQVHKDATESGVRKEMREALGKVKNQKNDNLKNRAEREIERRLQSLKRIIEKITKVKKISEAQKTELIRTVQTEITNLTTLQSKINNETDTQQVKTDVQSIVKSYRIFALFIPKIHIIASSDKMLTVADKLDALAAKLETQAKNVGNTSVSELLSDMKTQIGKSRTEANNAITTVTSLMPDGFPENKTTLKNARVMLRDGQKNIMNARQDAVKIIHILGGGKEKNSTDSALPKEQSASKSGDASSSAE